MESVEGQRWRHGDVEGSRIKGPSDCIATKRLDLVAAAKMCV